MEINKNIDKADTTTPDILDEITTFEFNDINEQTQEATTPLGSYRLCKMGGDRKHVLFKGKFSTEWVQLGTADSDKGIEDILTEQVIEIFEKLIEKYGKGEQEV